MPDVFSKILSRLRAHAASLLSGHPQIKRYARAALRRLRALASLTRRRRAPVNASNALYRKLVRLGYFDPAFYVMANAPELMDGPGVGASDKELWTHYWMIGRHQRLRPSAAFNTAAYLKTYTDIAQAGIEPLEHYFYYGRHEDRRLPPTDIPHHSRDAAVQRIRASHLFDEAFYLSQNPYVASQGLDAAMHYLINGATLGCNPSPGFSAQAYLAEHPDVRRLHANPLLHYIDWGQHENRVVRTIHQDLEWISDDHPLPDDIVHIEQMAGRSFFARFGFSFSPDGSARWVAEATQNLAARVPRIRVDRLSPVVTIVIPVYGQLPFVLGCLDSLAQHISQYSVEIIVCDDASPAASETERLRAIPWIRYLRRESNGGFIDACNWAAEQARGSYVVLLNSDTRVAQGWLDELIGTFAIFPKAGLVGSKLFNEDLTLQEAGGIFWRDGSAWNYGRNDDPNHPRYCFARRVDYCSGAAIAIPATLWRRLGGFDTDYRPAYCEDADIAFRIRELGLETWYQPLARVIHYEGKTHGRDVTSGIKAYQVTNMQRLADRWGHRLKDHAPNGVTPHDEANRLATQRMLILDSMNPMPDMDSGSVVTMQMIRSYQELGFQITFLAQADYRFEPRFGPSLQRTGVECLYAPFVRNISKVLDERCNFTHVLIYRITVAVDVFDEVRRRIPLAPIMFHNIDLHYLRETREALLRKSQPGLLRAAETRRRELEIIARADCAIVTSSAETVEIQARMPTPLKTIVEMPIFVEAQESNVAFAERRDVMFLAGFAHPPNIDAAEFLVREVWPLLVKRLPPDARLLLAGASPSPAVQALATDRIIVTGFVPDLQPWFDKARVFTAPLRYGAGIKGKVIQSLALGTPAVISGIAAEGIGLENGIHALIADRPEEQAEHILTLYFDEQKWTRMQRAAYDFVIDKFSRERGTRCCQEALDVANATRLQRSEIRLKRELAEILLDNVAAHHALPPEPMVRS